MVIKATISQEGRSENKTIRVNKLASKGKIKLLEFRTQKDGGKIICKGSINTLEGKIKFQEYL